MTYLVTGDRRWTDRQMIREVLERSLEYLDCVVQGGAPGADSLARSVTEELGFPVVTHPAEWHRYGRAAGPIRNQKMLDEEEPEAVLAFHDDLKRSKGTRDMVVRALKLDIPVTLYSHNNEPTTVTMAWFRGVGTLFAD